MKYSLLISLTTLISTACSFPNLPVKGRKMVDGSTKTHEPYIVPYSRYDTVLPFIAGRQIETHDVLLLQKEDQVKDEVLAYLYGEENFHLVESNPTVRSLDSALRSEIPYEAAIVFKGSTLYNQERKVDSVELLTDLAVSLDSTWVLVLTKADLESILAADTRSVGDILAWEMRKIIGFVRKIFSKLPIIG